MKTLIILISLLLVLTVSNITKADGFLLTISYTSGEHSKDSRSSVTSISIAGNDAAYSVKNSGFHSEPDKNKTCTLTDDQLSKIQGWITELGLEKNDSLIDESTKYKSYEVFANISILIKNQETPYKIKINGDVENLKDSPLYKNALSFISRVTGILDKC